MFGRRRNREPEPAAAAPHPRPAVDGGLRLGEPPAPVPAMHARARPAAHVPAVNVVFAKQFANKPFPFGLDGEMVFMRDTEPQPAPAPAPPPIVIPPPDWQDELEAGALDIAAASVTPEPPSTLSAVGAMLLADKGDDAWPVMPGPPIHVEPLTRPTLPEPDWDQVEREQRDAERLEQERVRREARAQLLQELAEEAMQP